jgi:hypothetical protein
VNAGDLVLVAGAGYRLGTFRRRSGDACVVRLDGELAERRVAAGAVRPATPRELDSVRLSNWSNSGPDVRIRTRAEPWTHACDLHDLLGHLSLSDVGPRVWVQDGVLSACSTLQALGLTQIRRKTFETLLQRLAVPPNSLRASLEQGSPYAHVARRTFNRLYPEAPWSNEPQHLADCAQRDCSNTRCAVCSRFYALCTSFENDGLVCPACWTAQPGCQVVLDGHVCSLPLGHRTQHLELDQSNQISAQWESGDTAPSPPEAT